MRRLAVLGALLTMPWGCCLVVAWPATAHPSRAVRETARHVIGHGTPGSCSSAAVVRAVAKGGQISFNCGPHPVTIVMKHTAKVMNTSHKVVIDGGGRVTLSGAGRRRILSMNTCDRARTWTTSHCQDQRWPKLVVRNTAFTHGDATVSENDPKGFGGGGGAIFDEGGQLVVANSRFTHNRCHANGPDLGGAAIRALEQWRNKPVAITKDVFRGGRCSNGGALSSIGVSWVVRDSLLMNNTAIGHGANPARSGSKGGGSGGAIYCDGDTYSLRIIGTTIADDRANEGGGAIFFVSNDGTGTMTIRNSRLHHNHSAGFETAGYPGIFFSSPGHHPKVVHSTIN